MRQNNQMNANDDRADHHQNLHPLIGKSLANGRPWDWVRHECYNDEQSSVLQEYDKSEKHSFSDYTYFDECQSFDTVIAGSEII